MIAAPPDWHGVEAPVVVGCSGGADSLALLVLAADAGLAPTAVHVDHGMRRGSEHDSELVRRTAARFGAGFCATRVHVAAGSNIEARARAARYEALEHERAALHAHAVLVGHTADDQAETVLLNLLRGSGSSGLAGMPGRRGTVVRPLLGWRRSDTRALCDDHGLTPFEDPSNSDPAFRRNWIRHEMLPALSDGARRDLVPVLVRQASVLRAEAELLDELADTLLTDAGAQHPRVRVLASAPDALARRAVRRWLGTPPPSLAEVERVLAVARTQCRAAELSGGRRVLRRDGRLHQTVRFPT